MIIKTFYAKVVGVTFDNIQEYLPKVKINDKLQPIFEINNPYDKNAVALYHNNNKIGYLSKDIAHTLNSNHKIDITVTAVTGGNGFSYGCNIFIKIDDGKFEKNIVDEIFAL